MAIPKRPSAAAFPAHTITAATAKEQQVDSWDDCTKRGHFVGLYGVGGAGKTTLAAMLPGRTLFIDLEGSLKIIKGKLAALGLLDNITPSSSSSTRCACRRVERLDGVPRQPGCAWL